MNPPPLCSACRKRQSPAVARTSSCPFQGSPTRSSRLHRKTDGEDDARVLLGKKRTTIIASMTALRCQKQPWRQFLVFVQILDRRGKPAAIARVTRPLNNRMMVAYSAIEELELDPRSREGRHCPSRRGCSCS